MPQGPTLGLTGLIVRPTVTDGSTTVTEVRTIEFEGATVSAGSFGEAVVDIAGGSGTVTSITAGAGLAGGAITTAGTISLATLAAGDLLGNSGGSPAVPSGITIGEGLALAAGSLSNSRNAARLTAQWVSGATVANDTVFMLWSAPYPGTINSATYFTGAGSFDCAIEIAAANALSGTPVTGLDALTVSSDTPATTNASGANTFTAGQNILAVITSSASNPTDAVLNLDITWTA